MYKSNELDREFVAVNKTKFSVIFFFGNFSKKNTEPWRWNDDIVEISSLVIVILANGETQKPLT